MHRGQRTTNVSRLIAGFTSAIGIVFLAGCGPTPPQEPILHVEGSAGTEFRHVVTYIDHGEKTQRESKESLATIPASGAYIHKLDAGHDGVSVEVVLTDAEAFTLVQLLDGEQTVYDLEVTAGVEKLQLQAGQIHKPESWSTFLGLTVIWGMTGVCLVGLVTVTISLWRDFNTHQAKLARRRNHESA